MSRLPSAVVRRAAVPALLLALLAAGCAAEEPAGSDSSSPAPTQESPVPTDPTDDPTAGASDAPLPDASTASPEPGAPVRGLPEGVEGTMDSRAGAAWSPDPGLIYVVTYGSSTCARVADPEASWDDAHSALVVTIQEPAADAICTMDYTPTTSVAAVPAGVDEGSELTVRLGDGGEVQVQPRASEGQTGPVAWLGS